MVGLRLLRAAWRPQVAGRVVLIGSGPLEPLNAIWELSHHGKVAISVQAVDISTEVLALGQRLEAGKPVSVRDIAQACSNIESDGMRRRNRHFEDEHHLLSDVRRANDFFGRDLWTVTKGELRWHRPEGVGQIDWLLVDGDYAVQGDVMFTGCLTVNLRKQLDDEAFVAWLVRQRAGVLGPAVFCVTPAELDAGKSTLALLNTAGWNTGGWLFENAVLRPPEGDVVPILGDIAVPTWPSPDSVDFTLIQHAMTHICGRTSLQASTVTNFPGLGDVEALNVAWAGNQAWQAKLPIPTESLGRWEVPESDLADYSPEFISESHFSEPK